VDGAGHMTILFRIFIPLSKPALATIGVYAILGQWNSWFDGAIYMDTLSKFPLLTYLQTIVIQYNSDTLTAEQLKKMLQLNTDTLQSAQIFIATIPVLLAYPFLQKHFTKGLVVGSVKG
jgi:putative aldouronate transport system permease protein